MHEASLRSVVKHRPGKVELVVGSNDNNFMRSDIVEEPTHFPVNFQCESLWIIVPVLITDQEIGTTYMYCIKLSVTATARDNVSQLLRIQFGVFSVIFRFLFFFVWSLATAGREV